METCRKTDSPTFPHLFQPLTLPNGVTLKNRLLMGSMHTGLEEKEDCFVRLAAYYGARAEGGVGLIVTGGVAPNAAGRGMPHAMTLNEAAQVAGHKVITDAVHAAGGKVCMQILHTGRYAAHLGSVAPSAVRSPIIPITPHALTGEQILATIEDYVNCAKLAEQAGYDGVEIMGSEGYLLNQFLAPRVNQRDDEWGGDFAGRSRFPLAIVSGIRQATANEFIVVFRMSAIDLVEDGSTWDETLAMGRALEKAGVTLINTGIGWHEARVPTIAGVVPRAAFASVCQKVKAALTVPVVCSNRINTPVVAEQVLADGCADMVSLARPMLADPEWANKAANGQAARINTCIACNQGCLDRIFSGKTCTCLVNPRACKETKRPFKPASAAKKIAVVGAGPAGLACAVTAAARGHQVTLFEQDKAIGGQLLLARRVPGKEEFGGIIRYYEEMLVANGVTARLGQTVTVDELRGFDERVIATGATPRPVTIAGADLPLVMDYAEALTGAKPIGQRVAIIGAGIIAFDVAAFLLGDGPQTVDEYFAYWGIAPGSPLPGGLASPKPVVPTREIHILHRSSGQPGTNLGKTTGWIHRTEMKRHRVRFHSGVSYQRIDQDGLWIVEDGQEALIKVDTVILCAGQVAESALAQSLAAAGLTWHSIGGAKEAKGLDAMRAISEGVAMGDAL